jgi:hypothetical protein
MAGFTSGTQNKLYELIYSVFDAAVYRGDPVVMMEYRNMFRDQCDQLGITDTLAQNRLWEMMQDNMQIISATLERQAAQRREREQIAAEEAQALYDADAENSDNNDEDDEDAENNDDDDDDDDADDILGARDTVSAAQVNNGFGGFIDSF